MSALEASLDLFEHEKAIEQGLIDVGWHLEQIRDGRKYRSVGYSTFEDYCRERWSLSKAYVHRQIAAANAIREITEVSPMGDTSDDPAPLPTTERQTRPLTKLGTAEEKAAAWERAVDTAGPKPTARDVEAAVADLNPGGKPKPERRPQSDEHPAKFSKAIMNTVVDLLGAQLADGSRMILDPFAGTGLVHDIADRLGVDSVGVEIQPKWADKHERTVTGDSTKLTRAMVGTFDCVVTSPAYGNRMADHHDAKDGSDRATYHHRHGSPLEANNTGQFEWDTDEYRDLHRSVYKRVVRLLEPGGAFVLNVKDHKRDGTVQWVSGWHVRELLDLGLTYLHDAGVPTKGLGGSVGEHAETRVGIEHIYLLTKGTP